MSDDKKDQASNKFSKINAPTAGARFEKELPSGDHPIQLYSLATPNGQKVTVALEELGLKYDAYFINIMEGDQFGSDFVNINPNSKIPAMIDRQGPGDKPINLWESGSILLYLAEHKDPEHKLLSADPATRVETLNWLFFQHGAGPYIGQFGHFFKYARDKIPYAIDRYTMETQRLLDVLDKRLDGRKFLVNDEFSIADIAWFPWVRCIDTGYAGKDQIGLDKYKHVNAWLERILERDAVKVGLTINSLAGPREKH